jgi:hypothetical protein
MIARNFLYVSCKCPKAKESKCEVPVKKGNINAHIFLFISTMHILISAYFLILNHMFYISAQYPSHVRWEWRSFLF